MKLQELLYALNTALPLALPAVLPLLDCTGVALADDPLAEESDNLLVGSRDTVLPPPAERAQAFYLLPGAGTPPEGAAYFTAETDVPALYRRLRCLLEPELQLRRQLAALDRKCLSGTLQQLTALAGRYLGNPVMVVDQSFKALALVPETEIGIDSWDTILRQGHPSRQDYRQAAEHIHSFYENEITQPQIIPYTEPDGRAVRRMVGCVQDPSSRVVLGGVEVIELNRAFTETDCAVMERLCQLLLHFLRRAQLGQSWRSREERLLLAYLQGDTAQKSQLAPLLQEMPLLASAKRYYLASIALSKAQLLTVSELQALLDEVYPDNCSVCLEDCLLVLLCSNAPKGAAEKLAEMLNETGKALGHTVILSEPFYSLEGLAACWNTNRLSHDTAARRKLAPGCCRTAELFLQNLLYLLTQNHDLRGYLEPSVQMLTDYDRTHDTQLFHTLDTYLIQESDLNRTAAALFIHRNTLSYRLQRIAEITHLDLEDLSVRQILRVNCLLWDFYYGKPGS